MSAVLLFRCVAKGILKKALAELQSGQGFRQRLLDIANQTYGEFQKETRTVRYLDVLAAVALASPEESTNISALVVAELRSDEAFKGFLEKQETVERLLGYLEQVPVSVRNRFRRPMDPTGRSLPQDFRLARPEDLMVLLPPKAPQFRVGDQPVGNWRLVQLLGIGAFGEVWKAEDATDDDSPDVPPVALKFCLSPESIRNLRHESGLLQRIEKHLGEMKGIVRLRKAWLEAEPPCLEYEYVDGGDLCGLMGEWLVQTPEKRATLALQMLHRLAKIIAPLHEMDPPIVHRDLKPANVLVSKGPNNKFDMKISDFGISGVAAGMALDGYAQSLSQSEILTSTLRGTHTPLYASPEQRAGASPHPTDDVHALGVIGFQLLVCDLKRSPTSDWDEELRERGTGDEPIRILRKCLARKNNRYQTAEELREALQECMDGGDKYDSTKTELKPLPISSKPKDIQKDPVSAVLNSEKDNKKIAVFEINKADSQMQGAANSEKTLEIASQIKGEKNLALQPLYFKKLTPKIPLTGPNLLLGGVLIFLALVFGFVAGAFPQNVAISSLNREMEILEKDKAVAQKKTIEKEMQLLELNKIMTWKEADLLKEKEIVMMEIDKAKIASKVVGELQKKYDKMQLELKILTAKLNNSQSELSLANSMLVPTNIFFKTNIIDNYFEKTMENFPENTKRSFLRCININLETRDTELTNIAKTRNSELANIAISKYQINSELIFRPNSKQVSEALFNQQPVLPVLTRIIQKAKEKKPIPAVSELKDLFRSFYTDDPNKSIFWVAQGQGKVPFALNATAINLLLENRDLIRILYKATLDDPSTTEIDKVLLTHDWEDYSATIDAFLDLKIKTGKAANP